MLVEVYLPAVQVKLEKLAGVIPPDAHLKKLGNLPPFSEHTDHRIIIPCISDDTVMGYTVHDYSGRRYVGTMNFMVGQLASMPDPEPRKK